MKATLAASKISREKSTLHLDQAHAREHARFDFQNELALIGAELRRLRTEQDYSIESVAKAVKMSRYRLAQIEHGTYIHFGLPALYRLAEHYGVSALKIVSVIPGTRFDSSDATAALNGP